MQNVVPVFKEFCMQKSSVLSNFIFIGNLNEYFGVYAPGLQAVAASVRGVFLPLQWAELLTMQTDGKERSPLLEIKPASDHFRWLNLTRSLLAVIARSREVSNSHHCRWLSVVQESKSISIPETHPGALGRFYLTDGKPEK